MGELSISYFRDLLSKNVDNLQNFCKEWEKIYEDSSVPEEAKDEIRTTIGLTNLLLAQKLKQFQGLIDDSEFKRGEKEITCLDLQGFWDMVYNEIEKVSRSFQKLATSKENNWTLVQDPKIENKKKTLPMITKTVVSTKNHASAARQRLAEAKRKMKEQMALKENTNVNSESKNTVSKVPIIQVSLSTEQTKPSPSKKIKSHSKLIEPKGKENLVSGLPSDDTSTTPVNHKRGKSKEVMPLQCLTRSAKRALMAKQKMLQD